MYICTYKIALIYSLELSLFKEVKSIFKFAIKKNYYTRINFIPFFKIIIFILSSNIYLETESLLNYEKLLNCNSSKAIPLLL
jgi:hypothetical protein